MNRLNLLIPLLICLLLGVFFYLFLKMDKDPNAMPSALVGKPVPAFNLPALDGERGEMVDQTVFGGELALINVWATWCLPCREEHPFLMELARQGVKIIGVSYKDEPGLAQQWLQREGDPYYITVMDYDGRLGIDLGVFGAPETYLVDADGIIRYKHIGVLNQRIWEKDFLPLLEKIAGRTGSGLSVRSPL